MQILYRDMQCKRLAVIEVEYAVYEEDEEDSYLFIFSTDGDEIFVSSKEDSYYLNKYESDNLVKELYENGKLDLTNYHIIFSD